MHKASKSKSEGIYAGQGNPHILNWNAKKNVIMRMWSCDQTFFISKKKIQIKIVFSLFFVCFQKDAFCMRHALPCFSVGCRIIGSSFPPDFSCWFS